MVLTTEPSIQYIHTYIYLYSLRRQFAGYASRGWTASTRYLTAAASGIETVYG